MAHVSRSRKHRPAPPGADDIELEPPDREVTAQPRERPPCDTDDVYDALPELVLECDDCGEVEPAPVDAAPGDTFACAYCGEFAVVKEP